MGVNEQNSNFLYGRAETEEEISLERPAEKAGGQEDKLEERKLEVAEKDKDRKEKRYFSAFNLIVGCLVFLLVIYVAEKIVGCLSGNGSSDISGDIVEIIKALLFTLSGYLFANKEGKD